MPDEETTSGNGTFDLRTFEEASPDYRFPFDTPPHNRSFFEAHLQALSHYYTTVSGGRLAIESTVLPAGEGDSYVLEQSLIDYGNGRTTQEINERIVSLFRDGVLAAAAREGDPLDFSAYDDVIVIHAGLGGESSNELNDIPSAFINRSDLDTYATGPITVNGGAFSIDRGILLPEAGGTDGRSGLNGILARFYANQLGLPRLDNPEDGLPAIGDWSLMDTGNIAFGSSAALGLSSLTGDPSDTLLVAYVPSQLTAWSRMQLGWLDPVVIRTDTTLTIGAINAREDLPRAVKIPITADEYFLLENRISRLQVEGRRPTITLSDGDRGVWVANDDYDAFIPGSGVLIWHVDDAVVSRSGDDKHVNSHPDFRVHFDGLVGVYRKGIALEEADGLEDIGNTSASRVITSGIISFSDVSGGPFDPYYVGNVTRFSSDTTPSSNSNLGYETGVEIQILSAPGREMEIAIRFNRHDDNWPASHTSASAIAPRVATVEGMNVILNANNGIGNAWTILGDPQNLANYSASLTPAVGSVSQTADVILFPSPDLGLWSEGDATVSKIGGAAVSTAPVIGRFPSIETNDIWGLNDGRVLWGSYGPASGSAQAGNRAIKGIAVGEIDGDGRTELIVVDQGGAVSAIQGPQEAVLLGLVNSPLGSPAVADLDSRGWDDVAVVSTNGSVTVFGYDDSQPPALKEPVVSRPVPGGASSPLALADIDNDGFVEVLFGGDGVVWVVRHNGVVQSDKPIKLPLKDRVGLITASPLVADMDADGNLDIVVAAQTGAIYAITGAGQSLPGFPILATGPISVSPLIGDIDEDGLLELVAFTDAGSAHLWHLDRINSSLTGTNVVWGQLGGNSGNTSRLTQIAGDFDTESADLLPTEKAYCYPNPIRGNEAYIRFFLNKHAEVDLLIVNAVGQIVEQITTSSTDANTDNEIRWDTTDYSSGVYVCRLQATGGGRTETCFIKAAIIR